MQTIHKYRDLEQVLLAMKQQVIDSLPAAERLNIRGTPREIFDSLRSMLYYVPDPQGNELLQQLDTLLNWNGNNYHGLSGAGDCDCFTIAALAVLLNAGYSNLYAVLAGYNRQHPPVHIFCQVYRPSEKKIYNFDLTQREFNKVKNYPYFQRLPFSL